MLVIGFIGEYNSDSDKVHFFLRFLIDWGAYCSNVDCKDIEYYPDSSEPPENLLSIFYGYKDTRREVLTKLLMNNMKSVIGEQSSLVKNSMIVIRGTNNFTSINVYDSAKRIIRIITKFNFLAIYKVSLYQYVSFYTKSLYLIHLYHNSVIMHDDFIDMKYQTRISSPKLFSLNKTIQNFYINAGYKKIRVLASAIFEKKDVWLDFYTSFYLECQEDNNKVSIAYSFPNDNFRDYIIDATNLYLLCLIGINHTNLKLFRAIYIAEDLDDHAIVTFRYNINIDMYHYSNSSSYVHNLFVICITSDNIAIIIDDEQNKYKKSTIQIIVPYDKVKKYKLHENKNFDDRTHIDSVITQILSDGAIICVENEARGVFIILKA